MSKISPRLILRGRNPGNFHHSPTHEGPAIPTTTTSTSTSTSSTSILPSADQQHSRQPIKRQRPQELSSQQSLSPHQTLQKQQPQQQFHHPQPTQPNSQVPQSQHTQQQHHHHLQLQQQLQQQQQQQQLQQQQLQLQLQQQQQQQQQQLMQQQPLHLQQHVQLQLQHELLKQQELQEYLQQLTVESDLATHMTSQMPPQSFQPQLNAPISAPEPSTNPSIIATTIPQSQMLKGGPIDQPLLAYDDQIARKSQKRTHLDIRTQPQSHLQLPTDKDNWAVDANGNIFLQGKVGINTLPTEEALTVNGNVLVTGNYLKPSDQRVKTNIKKIDGRRQLETLESIQLYEYDLKHEFDKDGANIHETGVLAQELRKVLPSAVQVLQNVTLADGTVMPELLVVQDRALLYENIGATKELGAEMRTNKENLSAMQKRSQDLKAATHKAFTALGKSLDYLLTETGDDSRDDIASSAFYCTLFGLGPAWTVYFLGFLLPPLWLSGVFYISSFQQVKKLAGFFSAVTLILHYAKKIRHDALRYISLIFSAPRTPITLIFALLAVMVLGLVLLCGPIAMSWGQKKARRRYRKYTKKKVEKAKLRRELGEVHDVLEDV